MLVEETISYLDLGTERQSYGGRSLGITSRNKGDGNETQGHHRRRKVIKLRLVDMVKVQSLSGEFRV